MPRDTRKGYKLKDGTPVPGVTSILGILAKPFLIPWANRMGLQGINTEEFTNQQKRIGTLIHEAIHDDLKGKPVSFAPADRPDYAGNELTRGRMGFDAYLAWKAKHKIEPLILEAPFVSESHAFGGTVDFYGIVDGKKALLDFTAGKSIYSEKLTQVIAYLHLLDENGVEGIEEFRVVRFPRDLDEGTEAEDRQVDHPQDRWRLFLALLQAYPLVKKVG
jgi:hypothetical protein